MDAENNMLSNSEVEKKALKASENEPAHIVARAGAEIPADAAGVLKMVDTIDRPGKAFAKTTYVIAGKYADGFENKPGKRIPKAGVYAGAGVGKARAEWSLFDAEAKGPNARAFAKAEVASASATTGPVKATVGLAVDTDASAGLTGAESIGRKMSFSVLVNMTEFDIP